MLQPSTIVLLVLALLPLHRADADELRITTLPVTTRPLPNGQFQPVARMSITVLDALDTDVGTVVIADDPDAFQWVTQVALGVDTNGDGRWEPGNDALLPGVPATSNIPDQVLETGTHICGFYPTNWPGWAGTMWTALPGQSLMTIVSGIETEVYLLYRLEPATPILDTVFEPRIDSSHPWTPYRWREAFAGGGAYYDLTFVGGDDAGTFPPFAWEGLLATGLEPADPVVMEGAVDHTLARIRLESLGGEDRFLDRIRVTMGSGNPAHITALRLVHDTNRNGRLDSSDVELGRRDAAFRYNPTVWIPANRAGVFGIPDGDQRDLLLLADFASPLSESMVYAATLVDMVATPEMVAGVPAMMPGVTGMVHRDPQVDVSVAPPASRNAGTSERFVATAVRLDAVDEAVTVQSISVATTGTARADRDLAGVELVHDVNGNGRLDPIDLPLATTTFATADAEALLPVGDGIAAGGRMSLLVVWQLAPAVNRQASLGVRVTQLLLTPAVPIHGLPAESNPVVIGANDAPDPEYDPVIVPDPVGSGVNGCTAGVMPGDAQTVLLALMLVWIGTLTVVRCRG